MYCMYGLANIYEELRRAFLTVIKLSSHLTVFEHVRKILKATFICLSNCPSAWNTWAPTARIFIKFDVEVFFENLSRKFKFS